VAGDRFAAKPPQLTTVEFSFTLEIRLGKIY
jgi:hypothetical protein